MSENKRVLFAIHIWKSVMPTFLHDAQFTLFLLLLSLLLFFPFFSIQTASPTTKGREEGQSITRGSYRKAVPRASCILYRKHFYLSLWSRIPYTVRESSLYKTAEMIPESIVLFLLTVYNSEINARGGICKYNFN